MKKLLILFIIVPFLAYSQSNELKVDKNNRKYILHKNVQGNITPIVPSSGVDYSSEIKSDNIPNSSLNKTSSSGWELKLTASREVFKDISFATPLVGYISTELGCIQKTSDGGNTWNKIMDLGFPYYWYGVYALTVDTVIIAGFNDQAAYTDGIVRWSYDGGKTWTSDIVLSLPYSPGVGWLSHVHFWNKDIGIVANEFMEGFYWTTNGGRDWNSWHYVLVNPTKGWFVGTVDFKEDGNIFTGGITQGHSSDFGHTWSCYPHVDPIFDGNTNFSDSDRNIGLTGSGEISPDLFGWIHKTTNGGQTWRPRILTPSYPVRSVKVFNESLFYAMGGAINANAGFIYGSTDGGTTWILEQNTGAEMFSYTLSYPISDSISIWCVGSNGGSLGFTGKLYKKTILNPSGVTPVELTSFTANISMGKVALKWCTATEANNRGFEIQRKVDDFNWTVIAFKNGNGTSTNANNYSFTDDVKGLKLNKLFYRLRQLDYNGQSQFSPVVLVDQIIPVKYSVSQNYPNPFNPCTMIKYQLPENLFVSIKVYNSLGQEAATLVNGLVNAGTYEVQFNASNLCSGVYYFVLKAGNNFVQSKKMILMK